MISGWQMDKMRMNDWLREASWIWSKNKNCRKEGRLHFKRFSTGNPMRLFQLGVSTSRTGSTKVHKEKLDDTIIKRLSKQFQAKNKALKLQVLLKCVSRDLKKPKRQSSSMK